MTGDQSGDRRFAALLETEEKVEPALHIVVKGEQGGLGYFGKSVLIDDIRWGGGGGGGGVLGKLVLLGAGVGSGRVSRVTFGKLIL